MRFSEYFDLWLNQTYYKNGVKVGKDGDFYTAVSVGSFFGICIANEILKSGIKNIVEIGSNEGYLIADIIQGIFTLSPEKFSEFRFHILEPHENLRQIQQKTIYDRFGDDVFIRHFSSAEEMEFEAVYFVCNELFDCFKCEIINGDEILFIEDGERKFRKCDDENLLNFAKKHEIKSGIVPLGYYEFALSLSKSCKNLMMIAFDYAKINAQNKGVRVYKNHQVYNFDEIENLGEFFGKSDITYSVDFDILSSEFDRAGLKTTECKSLNTALVDFGAADILDMFLTKSHKGYTNASMQFKHLMSEFGTIFKMIKFKKGGK